MFKHSSNLEYCNYIIIRKILFFYSLSNQCVSKSMVQRRRKKKKIRRDTVLGVEK